MRCLPGLVRTGAAGVEHGSCDFSMLKGPSPQLLALGWKASEPALANLCPRQDVGAVVG